MRWPKPGGRHWNFYLATVAGALAAIVTLVLAPSLFPALAASAFSLVYLGLTARDLPRLTPQYLREHADGEDAPPLIVFVLTIGLVIYVVIALFIVVNDASPDPVRLGVGVASGVLTWLMIHTMWGMHYAWEFYEAPDNAEAGRPQKGGLEFAGDEEPDGGDFIYYSLTIGMTDQTSDTNVTTRAMRRITTVHSLFSYFFNTVVVAAAVNIVVQLGHS